MTDPRLVKAESLTPVFTRGPSLPTVAYLKSPSLRILRLTPVLTARGPLSKAPLHWKITSVRIMRRRRHMNKLNRKQRH